MAAKSFHRIPEFELKITFNLCNYSNKLFNTFLFLSNNVTI